MRKLQNAFHVTAKYALRGVPEDEFVAYFPEAALPNEVVTMAYDGYRQVRIFLCDFHVNFIGFCLAYRNYYRLLLDSPHPYQLKTSIETYCFSVPSSSSGVYRDRISRGV